MFFMPVLLPGLSNITGITSYFYRPHRKGVKKISWTGVKNCEALTETLKKIKITEVNEINLPKASFYS
jgi:hypothetical protein